MTTTTKSLTTGPAVVLTSESKVNQIEWISDNTANFTKNDWMKDVCL